MRRPMKPISEQVIVITGASSGIGLATALAAGDEGARVVLASRNGAVLAEVAERIHASGGSAHEVIADVSKLEDVETIAAEAIRVYGGFDTWVNNAGLGTFGTIEEVSIEDHRRLFEVNFWGLVYGSKVALKHLKLHGGQLINLGSVASDMPFPLQGMYCASKHAIKGFTDALRMELEAEGAPVSVTLIKPSAIDTPFADHSKNYLKARPKLPPPLYAPEDVALAILHAAEHGTRDIYIGGGGKLMSSLHKNFPTITSWLGAHVVIRMQEMEGETPQPQGALFEAGHDGNVHGTTPHHVMRSAYTRASLHPALAAVLVAGVGLTAAAMFGRNDRKH